MRKITVLLLALAASLALVAAGSPAGAGHGSEGTITIGGIALCSEDNDPASGECSWTAQDPNGWAGFGPFTIEWTFDPDGDGPEEPVTETRTCAAGEFCQSPEPDPIPAGSTVTTNGSGGGTFAAGDENHDGE